MSNPDDDLASVLENAAQSVSSPIGFSFLTREVVTDFLNQRWMKTWSDEQIVDILTSEGRTSDLALWDKFSKVGYEGLHGANVHLIGGSEVHKLNAENEVLRITEILREFGCLTLNLPMMSLSDWQWLTSGCL